ncbi:MAG: protein-L-isoaspartate(D-aspartate) O-methyltransferase [Deltaproteobacteria bacterium]|nr:protein-L-isoaspartate(D-aspartate) O-methyltransferase [Deltaproteobacteria bacterium]
MFLDRYLKQRLRMVESQIRRRGIHDEAVLKAMEKVPRHLFVDEGLRDQAYADNPLPIGDRQTISQPYIVALMTETLQLTGKEKILEIGTGSGYQTAILAECADRILSIERIPLLAQKARRLLESLGYINILIWLGDGTYGWRDEAPFDAIIVTAGAPSVPSAYKKQLAVGGRLVIPVGSAQSQTLIRYTKLSDDPANLREEDLGGCRFVKLIGENGWKS